MELIARAAPLRSLLVAALSIPIGLVLGVLVYALAILALMVLPMLIGLPCGEEFKSGGPCTDRRFLVLLGVAWVPPLLLIARCFRLRPKAGGGGIRAALAARSIWLALGYGAGLARGETLLAAAMPAVQRLVT